MGGPFPDRWLVDWTIRRQTLAVSQVADWPSG